MQVEAVPLTDFVHGEQRFRRGEVRLVEQGLAQDLEQAGGLLRIRNVVAGPYAGLAPGKARGAGAAPPASASPAVPALFKKTATALKRGVQNARGAAK